MAYRIEPLREADLQEYFLHSLKVASESGVDGTPVFHPFDERTPPKSGDPKVLAAALRQPVDEPGWQRIFGLFHQGMIVGDLELIGGRLASTLHRARLGMGIQRLHAGKGQGERLVRHALDWAKAQPSIHFIELSVFSGNTPAIGLYEKCGFEQSHVVTDAFRLRGKSFDDVAMRMKLR